MCSTRPRAGRRRGSRSSFTGSTATSAATSRPSRPTPTAGSISRCSRATSCAGARTSWCSWPGTICGRARPTCPSRRSSTSSRSASASPSRGRTTTYRCCSRPTATAPTGGADPVRTTLRFLLGHEPRAIERVDPTMTVLEYLRGVEHRKGTKEGCAEGDCGACTVVLARPDGDRLRYEAVNACIRFLPTVDGCQLLTVEDLQAPDGELHPVQEAMVEANATQCGFCTPGFVMSLLAVYQNGLEPTPERVDDALAGNLCRCTGYGTIAAAGTAMREAPGATEHLDGGKAEVLARLRAWQDGETLAVEGDGRRFFAPATADELARLLLEHPEATVLAGGTDVGLWVTKLHRRLETVIYVGRVHELAEIRETDHAIEIGAGVTYREATAALAGTWPDMGEVIRRLGSVQIRNCGTIGGNIANGSPIGDSPPLLIAAGATLVLRRGDERREMPLEDFFLAYGKQDRRPGEFVEKVVVKKPGPGTYFRCYKISKRFDQDISAVCGAFRIDLDGKRVASARIAFGGMAATPKRAAGAEAALTGRRLSEEMVEAAVEALAADYAPIGDMRASADYRMRVARNLLRKCFIEWRQGAPVRVLTPREPALV